MRRLHKRSRAGLTAAVLIGLVTVVAGQGLAGPPQLGLSTSRPDLILIQATAASPLKRRDLPLPTVRPRLVSQDPAGDNWITCIITNGSDTGGNARATPSDCVVEITDTLGIWYRALEDSNGKLIAPISVAITDPAGNVRKTTVNDASEPTYLRPGTPLGRYTFVATAGGRSVSGGYTVKAPTQRILVAARDVDQQVMAGRPVTVDLAGYRPSERVMLYLYRWVDHRDVGTGETIFEYATQIRELTTDQRGEAAIAFPTELDDPPGSYLVVSSPTQENLLYSGIFDVEK